MSQREVVQRYQAAVGDFSLAGRRVAGAIRCYGDTRERLLLQIGFVRGEAVEPLQTKGGGPPVGFRPFSEFAAFVDVLRNEKPVALVISGDEFRLVTGPEPPGEGE